IIEEPADDRGQVELLPPRPLVVVEGGGHLLAAGPAGLRFGRLIGVELLEIAAISDAVEELP
ncbi:MAG: hypothetical protein O3C39_12845, partial [Planctomycetota bacterium]|nr:hypothetical protein [Planctomycetota bacterium]